MGRSYGHQYSAVSLPAFQPGPLDQSRRPVGRDNRHTHLSLLRQRHNLLYGKLVFHRQNLPPAQGLASTKILTLDLDQFWRGPSNPFGRLNRVGRQSNIGSGRMLPLRWPATKTER